jgi:hypothetical protein
MSSFPGATRETALFIVPMLFVLICSGCSRMESTKASYQAVGKCPNCNTEVKGQMISWNICDSEGNTIPGTQYNASCKCGVSLYARVGKGIDPANINWQILKKKDRIQKTDH